MACISSAITVAACRGPIHRKCRYKVTCKNEMRLRMSKQAAATMLMSTVLRADHLVELVDVVGQEVHDLPRGRLGKRFAAETKSLGPNKRHSIQIQTALFLH